jgi:hypothetical protein
MHPSAQAAPPMRSAPLAEVESGGLAEGIAARGRQPVAQMAGELNVPTLGTFTATNSKYYAGQVVDAISGTQYDAATGQVTAGPNVAAARNEPSIEFHWDDDVIGTPRHLSRFAGVFAIILLLTGLCTAQFKAFYVIPLVVAQIGAGLLLPVMRVVPWQDEDSDDLWWLLGLTLVFGPGIGLIAYAVKALVLQEYNMAVIGLFVVGFLIYLTTQIALGGFSLGLLGPPWTQINIVRGNEPVGIAQMFVNWSVLLAMAGWFGANVFHKLDE